MEVQEFVKETISQILRAVKECQVEFPNQVGVAVNPGDNLPKGGKLTLFGYHYIPVEMVEFDIAVTTSTRTDANGKIGISVAGVGVDSSRENADSSRVKFSVPITFSDGRST